MKTWVKRLLFGGGIVLLLLVVVVGSFIWRMKRDEGKFPSLVKWGKATNTILLQHVDIYPGFGKERQRDRDVLIVDGKIKTIVAGGTLATQGAHVINGKGHTLLPGLVDAHTHVMSSGAAPWAFAFGSIQHNLQAYLRAGVTTVYDLGGMDVMLRDARDKVAKGTWVGPQVFHTHTPITIPNGHPIPATKALMPWPLGALSALGAYTIENVDDAPEIIAALHKRPIDFIKIIRDQLPPGGAHMKPALLKALIKEAKRKQRKVFVHIGSAKDALLAAKAGADALAHMIYRGSVSQAQAKAIAKTGTTLMTTLHGFEVTATIAEGKYKPTPIERKLHPSFLLSPLAGKAGAKLATVPVVGPFAKSLIAHRKHWPTNLMRLYKAGVPMVIGTDSALPGVFPGSSYHLELQALAKIGIPTHVLLEAATSRGAALLTKKPNFGTIAPNKRADLLLVRGNPLQSIRQLQQIKAVIARGRLVEFVQ